MSYVLRVIAPWAFIGMLLLGPPLAFLFTRRVATARSRDRIGGVALGVVVCIILARSVEVSFRGRGADALAVSTAYLACAIAATVWRGHRFRTLRGILGRILLLASTCGMLAVLYGWWLFLGWFWLFDRPSVTRIRGVEVRTEQLGTAFTQSAVRVRVLRPLPWLPLEREVANVVLEGAASVEISIEAGSQGARLLLSPDRGAALRVPLD